jgi:hypothetical protein
VLTLEGLASMIDVEIVEEAEEAAGDDEPGEPFGEER